MTRMDAFAELLTTALRHGKELDSLLFDLQSQVEPDTFDEMRRMCGRAMAEYLQSTINPTVIEFPSLRPEGLNQP
jgi:hypothetical protein